MRRLGERDRRSGIGEEGARLLQGVRPRLDHREHVREVRRPAGGGGEVQHAVLADRRDEPLAAPVHDGSELPSATSRMATARVNPAEARPILTGKHEISNSLAGSASRFESFSMWQ